MMDKHPPTLTDAKGMGGMHAQAGFEYQIWDAIIRLPAWLKNPAFEGFGNEVLEDIEARFFAPHAPIGHLLERLQAKSSQLTKAEIKEVVENFKKFDSSFPRAARVHTLVTPSLPKKLEWLARDTDRIRRARPFYAPFSDIQAASDTKLRSDLGVEFGENLGNFFSESVEISLRQLPDSATAETAFATAFHRAFPGLNINHRALLDAHAALFELCRLNRGGLISRSQILAVLRENLQADLFPDTVLPLHILSDRNASRDDAIEIDARSFAGGDLPLPDPEQWQIHLLDPLVSTATWARKRSIQRVNLSGSFRISTAFAVGWAFRSAVSFEIDIPTRTGVWPTDLHPPASGTLLPWLVSQPQQLLGGRLLVGIGVLRDPSQGILSTCHGANEDHLLTIFLPEALADAIDVQSSIRIVKSAIDQACATLRPSAIDVFYVGPAAFAIALGHRWNGLPKSRIREYLPRQSKYTPTVSIG